MRKNKIALILGAVIIAAVVYSLIVARHPKHVAKDYSSKKAALLRAQKELGQLRKQSSIGQVKNSSFENYEIDRYAAADVRITECLDYLDRPCLMPITAIAGRLDDGTWILSVYWLDADDLVEGFQLQNSDGSLGRVPLTRATAADVRSYKYIAIHSTMFDLIDGKPPLRVIEEARWPKRGKLSLSLEALSKNAEFSLLSADGSVGKPVPIFFAKPFGRDRQLPTTTRARTSVSLMKKQFLAKMAKPDIGDDDHFRVDDFQQIAGEAGDSSAVYEAAYVFFEFTPLATGATPRGRSEILIYRNGHLWKDTDLEEELDLKKSKFDARELNLYSKEGRLVQITFRPKLAVQPSGDFVDHLDPF